MGTPFPRFTTEYISTPLAFAMSTGLIKANVAMYSALPLAFRERELNIGDQRVLGIAGIELAVGLAGDLLVLPGGRRRGRAPVRP